LPEQRENEKRGQVQLAIQNNREGALKNRGQARFSMQVFAVEIAKAK
jgi:hypothetical protein